MSLPIGSRIGPYEIVALLGGGGMGEVYRGRDTRLGREVAVKILPAEVSTHPDRLRRFEQEARSASSLNHPNIITIYDIGAIDSSSYIAMEFVDGKTLRELLAEGAAMPARKTTQIAVQLAEGLAKAHEMGIIHRDLKPENIMITKDGHAKILDFGLAKLFLPVADQVSQFQTAEQTGAGMILGTVGYMSPEQASGAEVDFRSDQFSFGAILYEMVTGKRAFHGKTTVETLAAIIKDDPQPISSSDLHVPAPLRWTIERCLEKNPSDRYASTRDLARDLQSIRDHFSEVVGSTEVSLPSPVLRKRSLKKIWDIAAIALIFALAAVALYALSTKKVAEQHSYLRLTYRRGPIQTARFTPDGQNIIYSGSFDGRTSDLYQTRPEGVESRSLGIQDAQLLSISPSGEMLILLKREKNILARMPMTGGSPRELDEDVFGADWTPDGASMALTRSKAGLGYLEYPPGKTLYESVRQLDRVHLSPKGTHIAFIEHVPESANGVVHIIDLTGKEVSRSAGHYPDGISWKPDGNEVWFTTWADKTGGGSELYALSASGSERLIARFPALFSLMDINTNGRLLVRISDNREILMAVVNGIERDLSCQDQSEICDFSPDGSMLLIHESGEGGESPGGTIYIRKLDGSPAVRLAGGSPRFFSPDGKWVLSFGGPGRVILVPTGVGSIRSFRYSQFEDSFPLGILPNGKEFVLRAFEKNKKAKLYLQSMNGGEPKAIPGSGEFDPVSDISPDGHYFLSRDSQGKVNLHPIFEGNPKPLMGMETGDNRFPQWTRDGKSIFVYNSLTLPAKIFKVNIMDGTRQLFKEIMPADATGVTEIDLVRISPDEKSYAYSYRRELATLYLLDGIH
jgi:eukaryotic-like serine/threonine-protein kinase